MTEWRPKNWAKIQEENEVDCQKDTEGYYVDDYTVDFEAGADAMLKVLKSEGEYVGKGSGDTKLYFYKDRGWCFVTGWKVFIPEGIVE